MVFHFPAVEEVGLFPFGSVVEVPLGHPNLVFYVYWSIHGELCNNLFSVIYIMCSVMFFINYIYGLLFKFRLLLVADVPLSQFSSLPPLPLFGYSLRSAPPHAAGHVPPL